jgi:hypothetical protein
LPSVNPGIKIPENNALEGKAKKSPKKRGLKKSIAVLALLNME